MAHLHFISGMPRSGSTLLSGILRQNPRFHAAVQGPLAELFRAVLQVMSSSEGSTFLDDPQRQRILRGLFDSYYAHMADVHVVFDTHRSWSGWLATIAAVCPDARVICCVRNPAWVLDSIERIVQSNPLRMTRLFSPEQAVNIYTRCETLATKHLLAPALQGVRQAWFGEQAGRIAVLPYDSLVQRPAEVVARLYDLLGEPTFAHDFANVEYNEERFDEQIGAPGMHRVSGPVRNTVRQTILPPDLFSKHDKEFWNDGPNPRQVEVL
jgi:sulfotransferase